MKKILLLIVIIIALKSNAQDFPYQVINASESYNGVFGQAYITFKYINPANPVLQRPLIVAEGYDYGEILSPEEPFGETDIRTGFLNQARNTNISQQLAQLIDGNLQEYDVVYVDWKNGTDYMERNALVLEEVIRWVNNHKVAVNGVVQPNVLLGFSMGGVLARYALKDMEDKSENHQTRLFISWDAPQQGAVVPKGFAHLARHARDLYIQTGPVGATIDVIRFMRGEMVPGYAVNLADRPASRQLLINYVDPLNQVDNSMFNSWHATLHNKGYPTGGAVQNFSMIAVSNGSECAKMQEVPPGGNLLSYYGRGNTKIVADLGISGIALSTAGTLLNQPSLVILGTFPGRNDFEIDLLVNSQADGSANQVYKGKVTYKKKILWLIPVTKIITNRSYDGDAATFPYESYAGGFIDVRANGPDLNDQSISNKLFNYNVTASIAPSFGFVPVPSALDIGAGNVTLNKTDYLTGYHGSNPPTGTRASSFPAFITAYHGSPDNEQHIQIETRNGNWVASRIQNGNGIPENCAFACPGATINGDNDFCLTSNSYTIPSLPTNVSVSWSATPSGVVNINCSNCTQTTLSRINDGTITLTATVTGTTCSSIIAVQKTGIRVGTPPVPGPITFLLIDVSTGKIQAQIDDVAGAASYNWYKNGVLHTIHHGTFAQIPISTSNCDIEYDISVEAVNDCGVSSQTHANAYVPCENLMMISPNPSSGDVTISADASKMVRSEPAYFDNVRLYDMQGNLKKAWIFSKVQRTTINISSFISGNYYIEISCGNYKERKLLLLQK